MKISQFWCSACCWYSVQVCRRHWGHPQAACTRPVQHDQDGGSIWTSPWDSWQDCWGCSTLLPGCTDRLGSYPPYYHSHHAGSLSAPCSPSQADQLRICWWEREVRQLWVVVRIMEDLHHFSAPRLSCLWRIMTGLILGAFPSHQYKEGQIFAIGKKDL